MTITDNSTLSVNNSTTNNSTVNNPNNNTANWIGFNKLTPNETLMQFLSGYIGYIVALTIYNLILLYQQRKRYVKVFMYALICRELFKYSKNILFFFSDSSVEKVLLDQKYCLLALLEEMLIKIYLI